MESIIDAFIEEIKENPEKAVELSTTLGKVVRPWECANTGQIAQSYFRRVSVSGEEVATIKRDFPAWSVEILGERPKGVPKVFNAKDAERLSKSFADEELVKLGYILITEKEDNEG